jgi:hypothetical protein
MIESEEIVVAVARFDLTRPIHGDASAFEAGSPKADRSSMRFKQFHWLHSVQRN